MTQPRPPVPVDDPIEFVCEPCGWEGTEPDLDPHLNAFCPDCGRPAEFRALLEDG